MTTRRRLLVSLLLIGGLSAAFIRQAPARPAPAVSTALPANLGDQEFWRLAETFSEPGGTFHSDNFVSNEGGFQRVIPELLTRARPGGLYVGVGPEQNFTYMAALRPRMAFILDIRRGNLQEHLLYKALMEMSSDRADFLARLFSRDRPAGLGPTATVEAIFGALDSVRPTEAHYRANLKAITDWLTKKHGFALHPEDIEGLDYIYKTAFLADGPDLGYALTGRGRVGSPSYAELMAVDDGAGKQRSYLATEESFAFIKQLESRNLIVPVVGDFAGPQALRAIGKYVRDHGATVGAFYLSNVEQYLRQDGKWDTFCANVASMPLDPSSTFIRSVRGGGAGRGNFGGGGRGSFEMFTSSLGDMRADTRACAAPSRRDAAGVEMVR